MKKFFSAFLLMTAMVLSVGTFVACNDLTDEMTDVKTQTTQNAATIDALSAKITALETALASAQSAADEAKTAAAAAKQAGDNALAEAQAAKAAAATAEANAIAEAKKQVEALKAVYEAKVAEIETALAGKATQADIEAAVKKAADDAAAALAVIDAKVALKADKTEVEALVAADAAINKEIEALKEFKKLAEELHIELTTDVDSLQLGLADAQAEIEEIWAALYDEENGLFALIGGNASAISANTALIEALDAELDGFYAEVFGEGPNSIMSILGTYANQIAELQAKVDALSVLQSRILSIAYVPEVLLDGRGVIDFLNLYTYADGELVFVNSAPTTATYLFNPTKANLEGVQFEMATRGIKTRAAEVATLSIADYNVGQGGKQGRVEFSLTANGELPARGGQFDVYYIDQNGQFKTYVVPMDENQVLASLVATAPNGDVIYSDEAFVQESWISAYQIINKELYDDEVYVYNTQLPTEAQDYYYDLELVYNETINLYDYVETYLPQLDCILSDIKVTPSYKLTKVDEFFGWTPEKTNQQKFVTLAEDGTIAVDREFLAGGIPAIGRTPAFKVESQVLNAEGELVTVATAYIIVKIVAPTEEPEELEPVTVTLSGDFVYTELTDGSIDPYAADTYGRVALDWITVNQQILDKLNMTNEQFVNEYVFNSAGKEMKFIVDGEEYVDEFATPGWPSYPAGVTVLEDWTSYVPGQTTTATPMFLFVYNPVAENTVGSAIVTLKAYGRPDVVLTFNYSVTHEHVWPEFNPDYVLDVTAEEKAEVLEALELEDITYIQVKGKLDAAKKWILQSEMQEHFFEYLKGYESPANHSDLYFAFYFDATEAEATITGTNWADMEIALDEPLVGDHKDILVQMVTQLANGNYCTKPYVVRFVNPFVATLSDVTLKTFQANPDSKEILNNLVIKDRDGKVVFEKGKVAGIGGTTYKFVDSDFDVKFTCTPDASFGNETTDGALKLTLTENPWKLTWYNGGNDLQQDKATTYSVAVAIDGISVVAAEANVKVLSTANSK